MPDGDFYQYREIYLTPLKEAGFTVTCRIGMLTVREKVYPVTDVTIKFRGGIAGVNAARLLTGRLLAGKYKFVLEEPELVERANQIRGTYYPEKLKLYDRRSAQTALFCHLPWQLYGVSRLWSGFLARRDDKLAVRQLRVKIRRLRSLLTLLKPLLPEEGIKAGGSMLKSYADKLSATREYDVALLACDKLQRYRGAEAGENAVCILDALLLKMRDKNLAASLRGVTLNGITKDLAELQLFLYSAGSGQTHNDTGLREFFSERFTDWSGKLLLLRQKYPDLQDVKQLHKMRIKLKRFRYALQTVPEISLPASLLRNLKSLQDLLGFLHDAHINSLLVDDILRRYPDNSILQYEGAMLLGWERGKADLAMEGLPRRWGKFCDILEAWREENL